MRATLMYGAGDVRVESVPDAQLVERTDALVRVTRSAICGSDLWPYKSMDPTEAGRRMGHEFIGVVEDVGNDVRTMKKGESRGLTIRVVGRKVLLLQARPSRFLPARGPLRRRRSRRWTRRSRAAAVAADACRCDVDRPSRRPRRKGRSRQDCCGHPGRRGRPVRGHRFPAPGCGTDQLARSASGTGNSVPQRP
jgi:hypothetical protein